MGVMLGREARGSGPPEAGAREDSVLRSGTKTPMNDPTRADLRPAPYNVWVSLRGEFRLFRPSAGASRRDILGLGWLDPG
jgi:hypothetical protein